MRCLIYCRVSSEGQRELRTIEAQRQQLPEYARAHSWSIVDVISDDGLSGTRLDRPGLQRVLKLVEEGAVDVLLISDTARITRSERDAESGAIYDCLRGHHCFVAMPGSVYDLNNPEQNLALGMLRTFDVYHRQRILKSTANGRLDALRQGTRRPAGVPPYGYAWEYTQGRNGKFTVVDGEAEVIRLAYSLVAQHGTEPITRILNELGKRTRKGGLWTHHVVRMMLRSQTNTGKFAVKAGAERLSIELPPIVSQREWEAVQRTLDSRRADPVPEAERRPNLLSGMVRCGCGAPMQVQYTHKQSDPKAVRYYRCSSVRRGPPCGEGTHHRANELEAAVWQRIRTIVLAPERVSKARKKGSKVSRVSQLKERLGQLDVHEKRILERSRRGLVSEDALDLELSAITRERAQLQQDLIALDRPAPSVNIQDLASCIDDSSVDTRRRILRAVLGASGSIAVHKGGKVKVESALT